jgi:hypothetical protein
MDKIKQIKKRKMNKRDRECVLDVPDKKQQLDWVIENGINVFDTNFTMDVDKFLGEMVEYMPNANQYVLGSFGAYGNPSSFHHKKIRDLRSKVDTFINSNNVYRDWLHAQYFDRFCRRNTKFGDIPSETVHSDICVGDINEIIECLNEKKELKWCKSYTMGGWVNLNKTENQTFSCVVGCFTLDLLTMDLVDLTLWLRNRFSDEDSYNREFVYVDGKVTAMKITKANDIVLDIELQTGFVKIDKKFKNYFKTKKFTIKPGQLIQFRSDMVHEVCAVKNHTNSDRLFISYKLKEYGPIGYYSHHLVPMYCRTMSVPVLPNFVENPAMFSSNHNTMVGKVNKDGSPCIGDLAIWSKQFNPICLENFTSTKGNGDQFVFHRLMVGKGNGEQWNHTQGLTKNGYTFRYSLTELANLMDIDGSLYPPYTNEELNIFKYKN